MVGQAAKQVQSKICFINPSMISEIWFLYQLHPSLRPFWLSPRQAIVLTTSATLDSYASTTQQRLRNCGFRVDFVQNPGLPLPDQIRAAQLAQYNYMLVIGPREAQNQTVNVRTRSMKVLGERSLDELITKFHQLVKDKRSDDEES